LISWLWKFTQGCKCVHTLKCNRVSGRVFYMKCPNTCDHGAVFQGTLANPDCGQDKSQTDTPCIIYTEAKIKIANQLALESASRLFGRPILKPDWYMVMLRVSTLPFFLLLPVPLVPAPFGMATLSGSHKSWFNRSGPDLGVGLEIRRTIFRIGRAAFVQCYAELSDFKTDPKIITRLFATPLPWSGRMLW
jgi:hypothetical protein